MGKKQEDFAFEATHGKIVNNRAYTYKQLSNQTSVLEKIKTYAFYMIMILLVSYCLTCIYIVDFKKGTQKDVLIKMKQISNYTLDEVVQNGFDVADELGTLVKSKVKMNIEKSEEIIVQITNSTQNIYTQYSSPQRLQAIKEKILNVPKLITQFINEIFSKIYNLYQYNFNQNAKIEPQNRVNHEKNQTVETKLLQTIEDIRS